MRECKTEQHIKDTAHRIFLKEGKMFATTQDIADAAGVNRTLLHYYFRSRELLFNTVFGEALTKLRGRINHEIGSILPFRQKIENMVSVFFEELTEAPYLETFIALQLNQDPKRYNVFFVRSTDDKDRMKHFLKEIQEEIDKGQVHEMKPYNFIINLFGLLAYPFVAKPVYTNMFELSDAAYNKLLLERKKVILSVLFKH